LLSSVFGQEIAVLSYNIRYNASGDGLDLWGLRKDELIQQIEDLNPMSFGVQEATLTQMKDLEAGLPYYNYVGVGRDDGATKGEFSAIFYKKSELRVLQEDTFWLSETPEKVSVGWDAALPRICTYAKFELISSKKRFWHFNTHFDHMGEKARAESAKLIVSKIEALVDGSDTVILSGDFNAEPHEEPIRVIKNYFEDPADKVSLQGPMGTFSGFQLDASLDRRIDYIFTKNVEVKTYQHLATRRTNGRWISDHLPILLSFELNELH
jgi:endonuclease/exonuclease/phosphatase family metal-dependent hydrolase